MNESVQVPPPAKKENFFADVITFGLIALLIVAPIRLFIAKPYIVNGASMSPTFETGHYLFIDLMTYRFIHPPERGDVIVFRFPQDPSKFFIKRVIGLPGETVAIQGSTVTITPLEGEPFSIDEPYVDPGNKRSDSTSRTLEDDEYFAMGDNRAASSDSRYWGPVPADYIVGRAFVRLFPIREAGVLPGAYHLPNAAASSS